MSNLGITHCVSIAPDLQREEWPWHTEYWVQLSWGEVVGGIGHEGLISALKGLHHESDLRLSQEADEDTRQQMQDKISELKAYLEHYLSVQESIAAEAESKSRLALEAYLDHLDLSEMTMTESVQGTLEVRFQNRLEVAATLDIYGDQREADSLDDLLSTMLPALSQCEP